MPETARPRALLHGASFATLLCLLLPPVARGLSPLVVPLAEPAAALVVAAALLIPVLPLPSRSGRLVAAGAAVSAAIAAALHAAPVTDVLTLAAATLWLGLTPRYLDRRGVGVGAAAGFAALPLAAAIPAGSTGALVLGGTAAALALAAFAWPHAAPPTPERRARSFRLRGLLALGALLYLDGVLRQAPGLPPRVPALMAIAGLVAAGLLWLAPAPLPARRRELLALAALAILATAAAQAGVAAAASAVAARALLVVLVGRALVPAGGRRARVQVSAAWLAWAAGMMAAGYLGAAAGLLLAAVLALLTLALLPRAAAWRELEST